MPFISMEMSIIYLIAQNIAALKMILINSFVELCEWLCQENITKKQIKSLKLSHPSVRWGLGLLLKPKLICLPMRMVCSYVTPSDVEHRKQICISKKKTAWIHAFNVHLSFDKKSYIHNETFKQNNRRKRLSILPTATTWKYHY